MQLKEVDAIRLDECCAEMEDLVMAYPRSLVRDLIILEDTEALQKYREYAYSLLRQIKKIREKISVTSLLEHFLQEEDCFFADELEYKAFTDDVREDIMHVLGRQLTQQEEIFLTLDQCMVSTILFVQSIFELPFHYHYFEVRESLPWNHETAA